MKQESGRFQRELKSQPGWSLAAARAHAAAIVSRSDPDRARRDLVELLFSNDPDIRKRAADVARRISDHQREFLYPATAQFAAILADTPLGESRTRWHLGLVVARTARSASEISTAAELLWMLSEDASNVVRCSAVEGLGELAIRSRAIRAQAEPYLMRALTTGTPAMKCRARGALKRLK